MPISWPHKKQKPIINTKRKIKKGSKLTYFTILHYNHPTKEKKLLNSNEKLQNKEKTLSRNKNYVLIVYLKSTC